MNTLTTTRAMPYSAGRMTVQVQQFVDGLLVNALAYKVQRPDGLWQTVSRQQYEAFGPRQSMAR